MKKFQILAVLLLAMCASIAHGQTALLTGFTGGSGPFSSFHGTNLPSGDVIGYRFTPTTDVLVTSLGILDDPSGDGTLDSAHSVGIWENSTQTLIASVSVDSSGTLLDGFYYAAITPVALSAGTAYTLGAMYSADDDDSYWSTPSSVTLDPAFTGNNGVFPSSGNLGFVYPSSNSGNLARIGPNALFIVPEPAEGWLMMFGLAGLAVRRRALS